MVYAGAPLFMWIWAIRVAVFLNNITASYFSRERVWATPYELLHGEPFPDASIVVPFGCAALVLLDQKDLAKFQNRCALMVFIHYADEHPLYTYAFYSPRTKRVLFRQDCIFLTGVFPMRLARQASGLSQEGEPILPFRSPLCMRGDYDSPHSFRDWGSSDPLPAYEDHVKGVTLSQPFSAGVMSRPSVPQRTVESYHHPFHPAFGEQSVVRVHVPPSLRRIEMAGMGDSQEKPSVDSLNELVPGASIPLPAPDGQSSVEIDPPPSNGSDGNEPPRQDLPLTIRDPESGESEFMINLEFPGQGRPRLAYRVYTSMPVRLLYRAIANGLLDCEDHQIRIFVDDACLLHLGTVTDRHFPDNPDVPTVFLYPDCTAFVRKSVLPPAEPMPNVPPVTKQEEKELDTVVGESMPQRRVSTRVPVGRRDHSVTIDPTAVSRRPVRDRWYYDPVPPVGPSHQGSSDITGEAIPDALVLLSVPEESEVLMLGPVGIDLPPGPLSKDARRVMRRFKAEGRYQRRKFRAALERDWESNVAPAFDQENDHPDKKYLVGEQAAYEDFMSQRLAQHDQDFEMKKEGFIDDLRCTTLDVDLFPGGLSPDMTSDSHSDDLLLRRTAALWAGLRRVYFGEVEDSVESEGREPSAKKPRNRQTVADFKRDIRETQLRIRYFPPRVPDDLNIPFPPLPRRPDGDEDDGVSPSLTIFPPPLADDDYEVMGDSSLNDDRPYGEDDDESSESNAKLSDPYVNDLSDRFATIGLVDEPTNGEACIVKNGEETAEDTSQLSHEESSNGEPLSKPSNGKGWKRFSMHNSKKNLQDLANKGIRKVLITVKTMRRILNFKENIMKYGVFVPRNDKEADDSPERVRWESGRMLEWMRLQEQGTFERKWDWERIQKKFPDYQKRDIGHMFFVYDFKHSGEHRVRLVFDGSRQNPNTYTDTYAPTARGESVRLFHVFAVEERWDIAQYDVPQAFLKSQIDCDIFVYPPRNFSEFPGQLLKLKLSLYGAKQSAALWNRMIDVFLLGLGFLPSPMDPCLYKRSDALIILFVDDLRVAAIPPVLAEIHSALFKEYQITTSDGTRFLGMDTLYDIEKGYLKLHMETYIVSIHERFHAFDVSNGVPFREIVGCLLWVCLCIMGPELLRVKDLARRSNNYGEKDFQDALKVLDRIYDRRTHGIVIVRGGAGTELIPSSSRSEIGEVPSGPAGECGDDIGDLTVINELREKALYKVKEEIADEDIRPIVLPINKRYNLIIYADASFAVGDTMQSVSGYVVFLNGTPLLWGSLKQTIVVDSSCSAEYVAASVACKQAIHSENLIGFLGFSCPKPYVLYTDSTACLSIASNALRLGNVRHLAIRYNLVRCYVTLGEIAMHYCITEEMVADLLTKIVAGGQDTRLAIRFYCLCPNGHYFVIHHE